MHTHAAGVVRGEFEQRVALPAHGQHDAVALELVHGPLDLEALPDLSDAQHTVAALAQEVSDRLVELVRLWERD